jgi:hypothetical protein
VVAAWGACSPAPLTMTPARDIASMKSLHPPQYPADCAGSVRRAKSSSVSFSMSMNCMWCPLSDDVCRSNRKPTLRRLPTE